MADGLETEQNGLVAVLPVCRAVRIGNVCFCFTGMYLHFLRVSIC